jgi:NhaP-type Na+/H+ or K+/H+ antiporter
VTGAAVFLVFVVGVALSVFLAHTVHRLGCTALSESAVTIGIGAAFGGIIVASGNLEAAQAARFDEELFALVFLPIIISESGLVMDKHAFFSQLFSILTFALVGTLIATLTIGGALFGLGSAGLTLQLTLEEALSFAALISAVDPVATLAVFSSLRVDPMLNALVYGEAVIKDAVAIVLFGAASSFITRPVTPDSIVQAILGFFVIMFGSLAVGVAFGLLTTIIFRFIRPVSPSQEQAAVADQEQPEVEEEQAEETGVAKSAQSQVADKAASGEAAAASSTAMASRGGVPVGIRTRDAVSSGDIELVASSSGGSTPQGPPKPIGFAASASASGNRGAGAVSSAGTLDEAMTSLVTSFHAKTGSLPAPLPPRDSCRWRFALEDELGVIQAGTALLMAYGSFAAAEALSLSGIVSSLFAGIAMNHWLTRSLSPEGRKATQSLFRALASLAETTVFFLIGANAVLYSGVFDVGLVVGTIVLCLLARVLSVFPLACCLNLCRKKPIPLPYMCVMWMAGLRGAIAYATSLQFPTQHQEEMVSATSWVVIFTIVVLGSLTEPLLRVLGVPMGDHSSGSAEARRAATLKLNKQSQRESMIKRFLASCDRKCLRPCLYAPEIIQHHASSSASASSSAASRGSTTHADDDARAPSPAVGGAGELRSAHAASRA